MSMVRGTWVVGVVVIVASSICACSDLETPVTTFSGYEDAFRSGAIGAGKWLPSWLPKAATDIREAHNIDTNMVWLEFKGMNSLADLGNQCRVIDSSAVRSHLPRLTRGFPRAMRESQEGLGKASEIEGVRCEDTNVKRVWVAARRPGGSTVYAWTLQ